MIIGDQWSASHHRSGWRYAIAALRPLDNGAAPRLVGSVEERFAWGRGAPGGRALYCDWVGVLHNPPSIPDNFNHARVSPSEVLSRPEWRESRARCVLLVTLSEYLARHVRLLDPSLRVVSLPHPTARARLRWALTSGRRGSWPILHVGWWLRRMDSFARLCTHRTRIMLDLRHSWVEDILKGQLNACGLQALPPTIQRLTFLSSSQYDALLARSVVFLDLIDASANNAIIECMTRGTPVIVNRLPAIEEYLGDDYPLYFRSLDEAAALADDPDALVRASRVLLSRAREVDLSGRTFRERLEKELSL